MPIRRVAFLTNEIPPYRVPKYRELAATPDWTFAVFTCVDREFYRTWAVESTPPFAVRRSFSISYRRRMLHAGAVEFEDHRQVHLPMGLAWDLWRFKPDVIISAEFGARTLIAAAYARLFRRRLYVYFEGTPHTERGINRAQRGLRGLIRRLAHRFLVNGRQGRAYLEQLGVPAADIVEIGEATDTEAFTARISSEHRDAVRRQWNIRGHSYLYCGRLIPLKGLDQLLNAWEVFSNDQNVDATLLLVGDGPERARLEKRVTDAGLSNVRFLGNVERSQLPPIYQAADVFVMPTLNDCWTMVIEEAFASGLPAINSIYTGSEERIDEGRTGWLVDPLDKNQFVQKLRLAWEARRRQAELAAAARSISPEHSIEAVVARIRCAVEFDQHLSHAAADLGEIGAHGKLTHG